MSAGWDKLREEIWTSVEGWLDQDEDAIRGGTPIEKLFFSALTWYTKLAGTSYQPVYQWTPDEYRASFAFNPVSPPLLVKPQVQLPFGRVDFVVWAEEIATRQYRRLIVECDGHDYHERTKEQAAKDRSRDREAVLAGYDVFRFTGSELWRDPWGCAEKVQIWAERGLP